MKKSIIISAVAAMLAAAAIAFAFSPAASAAAEGSVPTKNLGNMYSAFALYRRSTADAPPIYLDIGAQRFEAERGGVTHLKGTAADVLVSFQSPASEYKVAYNYGGGSPYIELAEYAVYYDLGGEWQELAAVRGKPTFTVTKETTVRLLLVRCTYSYSSETNTLYRQHADHSVSEVKFESNGIFSASETYCAGNAAAHFCMGASATVETATPTGSVSKAYKSGAALTAEGKHTVTVTGKDLQGAEYTETATFYVDRTAPALTRSAEASKTSVTVRWTVGAFETPVTATVTRNGGDPAPYTSGVALTAEGRYTVTATDGAGNASSATFYVDRTAPALSFSDGTTGPVYAARSDAAVKWQAGQYESPVTVTYTFLSAEPHAVPSQPAAYRSGASFSAEGTYSFSAVDAAGNASSATVFIDKTAPTLEFDSASGSFERWTNAAFTARAADALSGLAALELYDNAQKQYVPYDYAPRSDNAEYLFRVSDRAGNVAMRTVAVFRTDSFGNAEAIRNGFKLNAWYTVTLPARIFSTPKKDVAGRYSFETEQAALEFAIAAEREFRVVDAEGGAMYVSAANESIAQKYTDAAALDAAIEKYARRYVSERMTATGGRDNRYTEPVSLTRNSPPALPDRLLEYKALPAMFLSPQYVWERPTLSYTAALPYRVTAAYLGDAEPADPEAIAIPSGYALPAALGGMYRQGWYLIHESDDAGNTERYLVYSDAEPPQLKATAVRGDGSADVVLDSGYIKTNAMYFVTLALAALIDNADGYVTLRLEHGGASRYFTEADALPTLGEGEFGSGRYSVAAYDRSGNTLAFDVFIAGAPPAMTHGSLAADRSECRISFTTPDRYTVVTALELYRIDNDGAKTRLDSVGGTAVNAENLSYTLTDGGKYSALLTDNYARTVELGPIFFLKGLPSGRLVGAKDGGRTNGSVAFSFESGDVCELFVLQGGLRLPFSGYSASESDGIMTYTIPASDETSQKYLVFLHAAGEPSLFVEYTFEIDTVLPELHITDNSGAELPPDGATNRPFRITWADAGLTVRYYTAKSGSLGTARYAMNTELSVGTLYYFTASDDVGNTLEFTVLLDNAVDYSIQGKYTAVDGILYAAAPLVFSVNEPTQAFSLTFESGAQIPNGGKLAAEGRYTASATDNYGNTVALTIVIDCTPPTITLVGAENGQTVSGAVTVSARDYDALYLTDAKGAALRTVDSGEVFDSPGKYRVCASDRAGNSVTVTFSIDQLVEFRLSVPDGAVAVGPVRLFCDEDLSVTVTLDGAELAGGDVFTAVGAYSIALTDRLGNAAETGFVIVPAAARELNVALPSGTRIASATKDGIEVRLAELTLKDSGAYVIVLDCAGQPYTLTVVIDNTPPAVTLERSGADVRIAGVDKPDCALALTLDGRTIACRSGQTFTEAGHYVLTVTDALGNVAVFEWDIPFRLNTWAIVAICLGVIAVAVALIFIIRARRRPRVN